MLNSKNVLFYQHDIPNEYLLKIQKRKLVAWDIETSGLDWRVDRIGICQLYTPNEPVAIIKIGDALPSNLRFLLTDASVKKVFHHAMFDLRFMSYHWKLLPQNVACTKIAAKLLEKEGKEHTLSYLLKKYLGVVIQKDESVRISNWFSERLTNEQITYAVNDVIYLVKLLEVLESKLKVKGLLKLVRKCFAHIPTRVQLDILGYSDVYTY